MTEIRKNIAAMTDAEFEAFLTSLMDIGLSEEQITAIIDADCAAIAG